MDGNQRDFRVNMKGVFEIERARKTDNLTTTLYGNGDRQVVRWRKITTVYILIFRTRKREINLTDYSPLNVRVKEGGGGELGLNHYLSKIRVISTQNTRTRSEFKSPRTFEGKNKVLRSTIRNFFESVLLTFSSLMYLSLSGAPPGDPEVRNSLRKNLKTRSVDYSSFWLWHLTVCFLLRKIRPRVLNVNPLCLGRLSF